MDTTSAPTVAIVNQAFANRFWSEENPLGKRLRLAPQDQPGSWVTIVGVVSNIVQNDINRQRIDPMLYLPYRQTPDAGMWVLLRTRVPPTGLAAGFRREVQGMDPELPIYGPFPLTDRLERFWDTRFYGYLFLIFAAIALLLAAAGLYSVVAHGVSERTQEIGIRMAVGASAGDVLKLVLVQGFVPLGIGLATGLAGSLIVNRVLKSALIQVSPSDPFTLAAASGVLILAAVVGCWVPAWRAMQLDPVVALKHE